MTETYSNNALQNNGFTLVLDRCPQTVFRGTNVEIPGVTVPPPSAGFPGATQYFPGMSTEFDDFQVTFQVDEDLKNYEEIFRWLVKQRFAENQLPKNDQEVKMTSDGMVVAMTNNSRPNRTFYFKELFPISLSSLRFDTSVSQPEPVECTAVFKYSYFEMR